MKIDWTNPKTIEAIRGYMLLMFSLAFGGILLYHFALGHISAEMVRGLILGLLAIDRGASGVMSLIKSRNSETIE